MDTFVLPYGNVRYGMTPNDNIWTDLLKLFFFFTVLCLVWGDVPDQHFFCMGTSPFLCGFPNAGLIASPRLSTSVQYARLYVRPSGRQGGVLPFAVQQLVEGGGEGKGVLPDKLVGSDAPGFGMLGIGVERDAGTSRRWLLRLCCRSRSRYLWLVDEEAEVQVALRRQDVQAGHVKSQ